MANLKPNFLNVFLILFLLGKHAEGQNLWLNLQSEDNKQIQLDSLYSAKSFVDFNSLVLSLDSLVKKAKLKGFLDVYHSDLLRSNDSTFTSQISLGNRYIHIIVDFSKTSEFLKAQLSELEVKLRIEDVPEYLNKLVSTIAQNGQPFYNLQLRNLTKVNENSMSAEAYDNYNYKRTIDDIRIKGYTEFPENYITNYAGLKRGEIYSQEKLLKKVRRIDNLNFAKNIKEPEILFSKDSTIIYMYIEKRSSNRFDGFLGFGTDESTNKLKIDGYLNLQLLNNLNFGESLNIIYKSDELDQKTFNAAVTLPYLFKSSFSLNGGLYLFKKDSTFINNRLNAKVLYGIGLDQNISVGLKSTTSETLLQNSASTILPVTDYQSFFLTSGYEFVNRQWSNDLFPIQSALEIILGAGNRKSNDLKTKQFTLDLQSQHNFYLNERNSIYLGLQGSYLISKNYLDNELYRFGGMQSIRGFKENSLAANLFGILNTEYRYLISNALYVHSILDIGYLENKLLNSKEKIVGFGLGTGINTNAGLLRLIFAVPYTQGNQIQLSNAKIHLNFTARF